MSILRFGLPGTRGFVFAGAGVEAAVEEEQQLAIGYLRLAHGLAGALHISLTLEVLPIKS